MWKPHLKVIAEQASQAIHVLDRFNILGNASKAIDVVRALEAKQLKGIVYEPALENTPWLHLKRPENLTDKQACSTKERLKYKLRSVKACLHKERLKHL